MVLERSLKFFLQKVEGVLNFKFLSESGFQSVGELIIKLEKVLPIHVRIIFHNYVGNHGVLEVFYYYPSIRKRILLTLVSSVAKSEKEAEEEGVLG